MRVRVHFNLHRKDYSVVNPSTGRVIFNAASVTLRDVEFRVREKARQKVIATKCRSVHAYAVGQLCDHLDVNPPCTVPVTYNPYRCGAFHVMGQPEHEVWKSSVVTFGGGYCYIPHPK